ncbi:MAG: sulfate adenylyltransferase subunit CysD [Saprospiraceae bacterium]|nr:sulfate adenylyltransferase subunit CysD [Saprospiraceae bacterium]MCB9324921.1 sulfate adenylyltransferase subunit CysD [Lewinellaceae bacterium]
MTYSLNHLEELEAESIFIFREVAARFENPVLLFSGGKDSILLGHLARKAFHPAKIPFPFLHIDTGHNFEETILFRDEFVEKFGIKMIVASVEEAIVAGQITDEKGYYASRNLLQTTVLLNKIEAEKYDAAIGGGRRDEEKARSKERFFSHRDEFGQWDPKNQRPELWNLFNSKKHFGEHFRVFPISNWTELDVWQYLEKEKVELPTLYFAHKRKVFEREGMLLADSPYINKKPEEKVVEKMIRCRTIGDMTCTGVWESSADSIEAIIKEIASSRLTERGGRTDDKRSETSMEDRKKEGYF